MPADPGRSRRGPAGRAAARTVRALVAAGVLDRARDAAAIDRLTGLAALVDDAGAPRTVECPACEADVEVGRDPAVELRASRELRAWWQAVRERREAVAQGVSISDLFADLDADLRAGPP